MPAQSRGLLVGQGCEGSARQEGQPQLAVGNIDESQALKSKPEQGTEKKKKKQNYPQLRRRRDES